MTKYNICWLTATYGRITCLQRNIKCFLDQDYTGKHLMFIANTGKPIEKIEEIYPKDKLITIFNYSEYAFKSVGEKYQQAVKDIMTLYPGIEVIISADDDDIFLPNHLTEGNKGMNRAYEVGALAYKPQFSYFRSNEGIIRNENVYEPSMFIDADYLSKTGFAPVSIRYHQQWLDPLVRDSKILVDPNGVSTFIYNWGDPWGVYKMSGRSLDDRWNFEQHRKSSLDMGNGIITPTPDNSSYYNEIKFVKLNLENSK